jgi:hypothetical protein
MSDFVNNHCRKHCNLQTLSRWPIETPVGMTKGREIGPGKSDQAEMPLKAKRALLRPPILQVLDLYVTVGCVDGERRASAI